jgi:hypothetical protein
MQYLESNVKHSLEAFTLPVDHYQVRTFREALLGTPSLKSFRAESSIPDSSSAANSVENSPLLLGIDDDKRVGMNGGAPWKKKVPPHYWLEYLKCKSELSDMTKRDKAPPFYTSTSSE